MSLKPAFSNSPLSLRVRNGRTRNDGSSQSGYARAEEGLVEKIAEATPEPAQCGPRVESPPDCQSKAVRRRGAKQRRVGHVALCIRDAAEENFRISSVAAFPSSMPGQRWGYRRVRACRALAQPGSAPRCEEGVDGLDKAEAISIVSD